ncbi:MAG TPA: L,D-transpeptidase [Pseudolabrys sp.]|jgi:lipoprotein-anchoring transpeptidase ErfK/SrfK|nr:L,D-transpeptidase [Pseudolabrys sp.]
MVDYVSLVGRAVATLNPNTREQRHALYERARKTLADKLRATDPTLAHTDLKAERAALEAAILRVERDFVRRAAPPQRSPAREAYGYRDRPPLRDTRKQLGILAGALGVVLLLCAGVAAYYFWPRSLAEVRSIATQRSVPAIAEPADNKPGYVRLRQLVYYRTNQPVGTIVVDKTQTFLYVVRPNTSALRYSIGVGTECTALAGLYHVVRKDDLSGGNQPGQQSAIERMKSLLGARVLYLNKEEYRIHGSDTSGELSLPEGCIRLLNDDVIYLYDHTPLENRVVVSN